MYVKAFAALALAFYGVRAAPAKRDASSSSSTVPAPVSIPLPQFGDLNATYIPALASLGFNPTQTPIDPSSAIAFLQASSEAVASVVGTATVMDFEAALVLAQATSVLGPSQTTVSAFIAGVAGTPVVEVTSLGGGPAITLATGTAQGFETTFAGHVFTAAPQQNDAGQGRRLPRTLFTGVVAVVGGVVVGALTVP